MSVLLTLLLEKPEEIPAVGSVLTDNEETFFVHGLSFWCPVVFDVPALDLDEAETGRGSAASWLFRARFSCGVFWPWKAVMTPMFLFCVCCQTRARLSASVVCLDILDTSKRDFLVHPASGTDNPARCKTCC